jgi:hypothetical protein
MYLQTCTKTVHIIKAAIKSGIFFLLYFKKTNNKTAQIAPSPKVGPEGKKHLQLYQNHCLKKKEIDFSS